ncbi:hypothetical protein F5X98DRAFT_375068 [Xylaria grammica]|nr:hypothetical protein F5X98DRAFT_375068 [Xylaria grammica]
MVWGIPVSDAINSSLGGFHINTSTFACKKKMASTGEPDRLVTNERTSPVGNPARSYCDEPSEDVWSAAFLAWKLHDDPDTLEMSKHQPVYLQSFVADWGTKMTGTKTGKTKKKETEKSSSRNRRGEWARYVELDICRQMEDDHRYERDIIYTEKGLSD